MKRDSGRLIALRQSLHDCAEIAGDEVRTANAIASFLRHFEPSTVISNLGGWGLAAIYEGTSSERTVLVRCELDALPVSDEEQLPHVEPRYAHLCGHDGHMTMVAGLAPMLHDTPPPCRVVLLFQPAEETGDGARRVMEDPRFELIAPNCAIALHNLPGYPSGTVVLRDGTFASSSAGLQARLYGHSSHAAEPENARTPLNCITSIPHQLMRLATEQDAGKPKRLVTITHLSLGHPSFGITPGEATLLATLRSESGKDLRELREQAEHIVEDCARGNELSFSTEWFDEFPETANDQHLVTALRAVCEDLGTPTVEAPEPFRWSEDFGHFGERCPTLFFGLGNGEEAPGLHQSDYRFDDDIIPVGVQVFHSLIQRIAAQ